MKKFIKKNEWQLLTVIVSVIIFGTLLASRVDALEGKVRDFPDKSYFELRFSTLEKAVSRLTGN